MAQNTPCHLLHQFSGCWLVHLSVWCGKSESSHLLSSVAKVHLAFIAAPSSFSSSLPIIVAVVATVAGFHRKVVLAKSRCRWSNGWASCSLFAKVSVAVEVRKQTLYRKLILRKWHLKFRNNFDMIIDVVLDCLLYVCKTFNGHSARLCFMCVRRCIE